MSVIIPVMRESVTIKVSCAIVLGVCWSFKLDCCNGGDNQEIRNIKDGNWIVDCCSSLNTFKEYDIHK